LLRTNVVAPQQLLRALLPVFSQRAVIINVSSDAGVESYESWGGYGSSKAALDHQTLTWAAEEPDFTWYSLDPGDMRTAMHQAAFPGEDISDRPDPETVAPIMLALIDSGLPSGRYRAADLAVTLAAQTGSA
jgi:NAD(P)-dependent dehydrogenase (short-subunit alcohol dehydrogenase family)